MATGNNSPDFLTATDMAIICQTDAKTVHNWCAKKGMPHFRTPGRHLRFRPEDVVPWLAGYDYPIPEHLKRYLPATRTDAVLGHMQQRGAS